MPDEVRDEFNKMTRKQITELKKELKFYRRVQAKLSLFDGFRLKKLLAKTGESRYAFVQRSVLQAMFTAEKYHAGELELYPPHLREEEGKVMSSSRVSTSYTAKPLRPPKPLILDEPTNGDTVPLCPPTGNNPSSEKPVVPLTSQLMQEIRSAMETHRIVLDTDEENIEHFITGKNPETPLQKAQRLAKYSKKILNTNLRSLSKGDEKCQD